MDKNNCFFNIIVDVFSSWQPINTHQNDPELTCKKQNLGIFGWFVHIGQKMLGSHCSKLLYEEIERLI